MKNIILVLMLSLLTACSTIHKVPERNAEILPWETSTHIKPEHIFTNKPYKDVSSIDFIFLKAESNYEEDKYFEFMKRSLSLVGFDEVLNEEELARLIIKNNLANKISSASDMLSLHNAQKELGNFLIFQCELTWIEGALWETYIKITNPENIETLLEYRKKDFASTNVDKEFNYPIINLVYEWKNSSQFNKGI